MKFCCGNTVNASRIEEPQITMVWQIPSITMAINTFLGVLYLGYAKEIAAARLLALAASVLFTSVALVALIKHRFFEIARTRDITWLQNELRKIESNIREIKFSSKDIICDKIGYPDVPRHFITRISASLFKKYDGCYAYDIAFTIITRTHPFPINSFYLNLDCSARVLLVSLNGNKNIKPYKKFSKDRKTKYCLKGKILLCSFFLVLFDYVKLPMIICARSSKFFAISASSSLTFPWQMGPTSTLKASIIAFNP